MYKEVINDDKPYNPDLLLKLDVPSIIWGANNFSSKLPDNSKWIVWHKKPSLGGARNTFSDCELAWTNLNGKTVDMYHYTWSGMTREGNRKEELKERVHPTQKPVELYEWILNRYAKRDDKILDTHCGSASSLVACERNGFKNYVGFEIDEFYYKKAKERLEQEKSQQNIFDYI